MGGSGEGGGAFGVMMCGKIKNPCHFSVCLQ
jgi:hypothetical protein